MTQTIHVCKGSAYGDSGSVTTARFEALVKKWGKMASHNASMIRQGRYFDQLARVRMHEELSTLRYCANALARIVRETDGRK